jgi:hypothetical protein
VFDPKNCSDSKETRFNISTTWAIEQKKNVVFQRFNKKMSVESRTCISAKKEDLGV